MTTIPTHDLPAGPQSEPKDVIEHFTARAHRYNESSNWCTDPRLMELVVELLALDPRHRLLDVACGTGLVSRTFRGRVHRIVGLDITRAMFEQAAPHIDELVVGSAEAMPFMDEQFDRLVCRQGIQFMDAPRAAAEMYRVTRSGGLACLINLCAYGSADCDEYFEILRLRNPARRNFYLTEDLEKLLTEAGFRNVVVHRYVSQEDVDVWADNGAISDESKEKIRDIYRSASDEFKRLHAVQSKDGNRFIDNMLFGIAIGVR
jgi:SAM-dependent methyltransferase